MAEPVVELSRIKKVYKRQHLFRTRRTLVLDELSLKIVQGEVYCLLGLNGCGKTTTVKIILGLIFPASGEVKIFGEHPNPRVLAKIGYVSENPYLFPYLTGYEFLDLMGILSGFTYSQRKKRCSYVVEKFGVSSFAHKKIKEYSKGMQQRLLLAQAMLADPEILIMDEPYSGLDPVGILEMRNHILSLNKSGKTILLTSHIIAEAEKVATRAGILKDGKILKEFKVEGQDIEKEFMELHL